MQNSEKSNKNLQTLRVEFIEKQLQHDLSLESKFTPENSQNK